MTSIIGTPFTSPKALFHQAPKTTIIVRDLPSSVFIKNPQTNLSLADDLKILVINQQNNISDICYFSVLFGLQRIVIICRDEDIAQRTHKMIRSSKKFGEFKTDLSNTLIRMNDNVENQLSIENLSTDGHFTNKSLNENYDKFIANYEEPIPAPANKSNNYLVSEEKTLFNPMKLKIDTNFRRHSASEEIAPVSPSITLNSYEL